MSEIRIKCCPLLGCSNSCPPIISANLYPCAGEECINFRWDGNEGYCRFFEKYTNHEKEGENE